MFRIAVLMTCHNRKNLTLKSLEHLYISYEKCISVLKMEVYLTDDGSSDGTSEAVALNFPNVNLLKGNGSLFWAGGMRNSWNAVPEKNFDGYLLLNDDTFVYECLFTEIFSTHNFSLKTYNKSGIYVGSTQNKDKNKTTYGGKIILNKFFGSAKLIEPKGKIEECDLGNANIMFVSKDVYENVGKLSGEYVHGVADYDYTLNAKSKNIPVLVLANYVGVCSENVIDKIEVFKNLKLRERYKYLISPIGFGFFDYLKLQKKFFKLRVPFVLIKTIIKILYPKL